MEIENNNKAIEKIVNYQFEMIGESITYADIPEDGFIKLKVKGKDKYIEWYKHYLFKDEDQYEEWKEWTRKELKKENLDISLVRLDLTYGLDFRRKKEGQLF